MSRSSTKDQPLLGALDDDIAFLAVECHRGEARLGWQVVIPDIVVHELVAPHRRAGFGLEGDQGIGAAIVAGTKAAVKIRARARGRRNPSPRAWSIAIGAQTLAAPVDPPTIAQLAASRSSERSGTGSQRQRGAPVRTSKARTAPRGASTR